jgi:ornithine cyclodeaminase
MKTDDGLLVLTGPDIHRLLAGREREVIGAVRQAYLDHYAGRSCLPHSVFVRFPGRVKERIIALPGYLGGADEVAGIKWISSFPGNLERGVSRASAIMVLNSLETGRPTAVIEGSLISAARTAASAALAADTLHAAGAIGALGVVGCGLINREIVRFVFALGREVGRVVLYDLAPDRAAAFARGIGPIAGEVPIEVAPTIDDLLARAHVISFATTAVEPTVGDLSRCRDGTTVLHISLRDLKAEVVLGTDNVVDDVDHVMRAQTSLHLAEQQVGHRDFVRCALAEVLGGSQPPRRPGGATAVFSPFGLGVLDLAVARLVIGQAAAQRSGTRVEGFFEGT